jgi:COP9 signalosome complex subunit 4
MSSYSLELRDISSQSNETRINSIKSLIDRSLKEQNASGIIEIATYLVHSLGLEQFGRTYIVPEALDYLLTRLCDPDNETIDYDEILPLLKKLSELIRPKSEDYPEAFCRSIQLLSDYLQDSGDLRASAAALNSVKVEEFRSKTSFNQPSKRFHWFVKTAELWLAADEIGPASQQIKRALALLSEVKDDPIGVLKFKTLFARILDHERKFLEAAMRYMELTQNQLGLISEADLLKTLEYAISCAILAKAGPNRSRVLALLYSDERSKTLPNFFMLEKMFNEQVIKTQEVSIFEKLLQSHQKAITASGHSVLQNAVIEHNLLAASRLYSNIKLEALGVLLGISTNEAECLACQMIEQGRLNASIDQVEWTVEFASSVSEGSAILEWDNQINTLCLAVNQVVERIAAKHPHLLS